MPFRGGGDAGGRAPNQAGPEFIRRMPKFLQKYDHLIEKREGQRVVRSNDGGDAATPASNLPPAEDEDDTFEDQIRGATVVSDERDASTQPSTSAAEPDAPEWTALKDKGNAAFTKGDHKAAVKLFTEAIKMDPKASVLYSNRSAAYAAMRKFEDALADARKALQLQPGWGKAYSRIGAALFGLQEFEEAIEVYEKALESDPKSETYKEALEQAKKRHKDAEEKDAQSGKHSFRKRKAGAAIPEAVDGKSKQKDAKSLKDGKNLNLKRKKPVSGGLLSFDEQ